MEPLLSDLDLKNILAKAHAVKYALFQPIPERQRAGQAIGSVIMAAAEYRAQRDALQVRVAALEEENRKLRSLK